MNKLLRFEIRQNSRKAPRVYVKQADSKVLYGSFLMDAPDSFDGWAKLSINELIELKQFIQNITAIYQQLHPTPQNSLIDFRFRLPYEFTETLDQIEILCHQNNVELNIFEPMIASIIQQMKIAVSKLSGQSKEEALTILTKANLAEYKKQDFTRQMQAVFAEIQSIYNRSEKLHALAKELFKKDKSFSPMAIQSMAHGDTIPTKWLTACAIELLFKEKPEILFTMLTEDDVFMLWAKQLLDQSHDPELVIKKIIHLNKNELMDKIKCYKNLHDKTSTN
ncbi:hypothetical protein [Legionella saoudiensis]|uniref:hypothetical protein n=1 Tax=Legionella saoudiensis TaxID=1750561 RepID=UPI00073169C8|nr:hypothetical protein [Legionella saoudiensis]